MKAELVLWSPDFAKLDTAFILKKNGQASPFESEVVTTVSFRIWIPFGMRFYYTYNYRDGEIDFSKIALRICRIYSDTGK